MKRAIAKYLIDSRINSGKFVDLEEARASLPAWVRSMLSKDQDVSQYWELCCLLDSRLKNDANDFASWPKQKQPQVGQHCMKTNLYLLLSPSELLQATDGLLLHW